MPQCTNDPCSVCKFRVLKNHKAIFCNICHLWTHLKCTPLSLSEYKISLSKDDWFCPNCLSETFPFNHYVNDTDFFFALLDLSPDNFDSSFFESKYFNPFIGDPDTYKLFHNLDLDPDLNMLTSNSYLLSKCAYMSSRQFNHILSDDSNSNFFSLFHLNNCTLKKHSTLNTSFPAIGLSKTWLDTTSNDLYNYWNRRWG